MKYNSIGEQLITKAKEIDPNYKPDKFNDMSEAIDVILNNTGSGSAQLYLDITPYITQTTELNGTITQEGFNLIQTKLDNGEIIGISMDGTLFNYAYFNTYSVDPSEPLKTRIIFLHNAENEMYLKLTIDEALTCIAEPESISSGGDIWLDIAPYLNEDMTSISQEGFDLVWNAFSDATENPSNKYVGILLAGIKMFYNELVTSDKTGLNFISNSFENGVKRSMSVIIYNDKSIEAINSVVSSSNKIWYDLYLTNGITSGTITQEQYNEIKKLIDSNSLAGITPKRISDNYFSLSNSLNGTFTFRFFNLTNESNNGDKKYTIFKHEIIIKPDLSVSSSSEYKYIPLLTQNLSNQSIISVKTDGLQQNLTIGDGLEIKNGALKTKEVEMAVSITATLDDLKNAVNSVSYIPYSESNKEEIISFITNQKGIMKLAITTPVGILYMTLRPSVWGYDGSPVYDFEGSLILEKDLSAIGGSVVNQIIVRAICWNNTEPVHFRPTIIPIRK